MADTSAPTAPGTPAPSSAVVSWTGAADDVGVAEYDMFADSGVTNDWTSYWYKHPLGSPMPTTNRGATYGNGLFVVWNGSYLIGSPDGRVWTRYTVPSGVATGLAYGNGLWVAVLAGSATYYTSPDLKTWTSRATLPTASTQILYANGTFLTTSAGSAAAYTSTDGLTWTTRTLPQAALTNIAYGNGSWVAVQSSASASTAYGAYSVNNGVTWTQFTLGGTPLTGQVLYGGGLFMVLGGTTATAASSTYFTSPDGVTWTSRQLPASFAWGAGALNPGYGATWTGTAFLLFPPATNASATMYYSSPDGITWTQRTLPYAGGNWVAVSGGNTVLAVPGGQYYCFVTSSDGKWIGNVTMLPTATQIAMPAAVYWSGVAYGIVGGVGLYVAVAGYAAGGGNATTTTYATSPDGITWTQRTWAQTGSYSAIVWAKELGLFVVTCQGATTYTSPDGLTWTARTMPSSSTWAQLAWSGTRFVCVAYAAALAAYSTDGITWTAATAPTQYSNLCYGTPGGVGLFVLTTYTSGTSCWTSPDGITWTARTIGSTAAAYCAVAWDARSGFFVALTSSNTYQSYSADGITWTQSSVLPVTTTAVAGLAAVPRTGQFFAASGPYLLASVAAVPGLGWTSVQVLATGFNIAVVAAVGDNNIAIANNNSVGWVAAVARSANVPGAAQTITVTARDNAGNVSPASGVLPGIGAGFTSRTTGQLWPR